MPTPTYWDYLRLDTLLELQGGFDGGGDVPTADELHFVIVHQVYELWFKLVLRELRLARDRLSEPRVPEDVIPVVVHHLRRTNVVFELAVHQWKLVEMLTPQDFLAFRDKLTPASGFQSFQVREVEMLMGLDESQRIAYGNVRPIQHIRELGAGTPAGDYARARIDAATTERTFLSALNDWLYRTPIHGSGPDDPNDEAAVVGFLDEYLAASADVSSQAFERLVEALGERTRPELVERFAATREAAAAFLHARDVDPEIQARVRRIRAAVLFVESYRDLPLLAWPRLLLDAVVEMEQGLLNFRHGHARMVERVIGRRVGTGGSGGVDYLDKTTSYRVFRDLWAVRTVLLPRTALPPLRNADRYGFAG